MEFRKYLGFLQLLSRAFDICTIAQPLFWIYDQDKILKCLEGGKNPEFYEPTQNPFFIVPTGSQTMYGDSALAGIRGLLHAKGVYSMLLCIII